VKTKPHECTWNLAKLSDAVKEWVETTKEGGFCKFCKNIPVASRVQGGGNAAWIDVPSKAADMTRAVRSHKNSGLHKLAVELKAAANKLQAGPLASVSEQTIQATIKRLMEVYFLARNYVALHKFSALHELSERLGAYDGLKNVLNKAICPTPAMTS
jgi:hypothetical protein